VICDEIHAIRNTKTMLYHCLSSIRTLCRVGLTGTPLQNRLSEYYTVVDFVRPRFLGIPERFKAHYDLPIQNGLFLDSTMMEIQLARRKAATLRQLCVGDVIHEVDPKVLTDALPPLYDHAIEFKAPPLMELMNEAIVDWALNHIDQGAGFGFTSTLFQAAPSTASTTSTTSSSAASTASSPEVLLISIAVGNLGLNLNAANHVVLFDSGFNPLVDEQAIARAYRYGQTRPVHVYRFLIAGSMETALYNMGMMKLGLA
ncbi:hypothetical protein GQ42DRAFT_105279, partial [Ramicandelaber brevisporus]